MAPFDIPEGDAPVTLRQFAEQSGVDVLYSADNVEGVRTHSVRGKRTPRQALDEMVAGTDLVITQGKIGGGFAISKDTAKPEKKSDVNKRPNTD